MRNKHATSQKLCLCFTSRASNFVETAEKTSFRRAERDEMEVLCLTLMKIDNKKIHLFLNQNPSIINN